MVTPRLLLATVLCLALAVLSGLHSFARLNYDIVIASRLLGATSFGLAFVLKLPRRKLFLAGWLILLPLLCTLLFSWGELSTEFDPRNGSKGWGFLWIICSYPVSLAAVLLATIIKALLGFLRVENK